MAARIIAWLCAAIAAAADMALFWPRHSLALRSPHRDATGRPAEAAEWWKRAKVKGYGTAWRKQAREATGSGGATGVDLNLAWPVIGGRKPPLW